MHRHHYQPVSSTMAERNAKVSSEGPVGTYFSVLNVSLEAAFLLLRLVVSSDMQSISLGRVVCYGNEYQLLP